MRISSRGTVTMGPLGWLLAAPVLAAIWVTVVVVYGAAWLLVHAVMWCARRLRRRRRVPAWARRMPEYRPR